MMKIKYIILGTKDYVKDCWHDFWFKFWNGLWTFAQRRTSRCYVWRDNEGLCVKEGSVWHYIEQRKVADQSKGFWAALPDDEYRDCVYKMISGYYGKNTKTKYVRKRTKCYPKQAKKGQNR